MAQDDALSILVELDNLELQFLVLLGWSSVFLNKVLGSCETFNAVRQADNSALVEELGDSALVDATHGVNSLKVVPRIVLKLLVTKAQAAVILVNLKNNNVDVGTNLSELAWVLNLLGP